MRVQSIVSIRFSNVEHPQCVEFEVVQGNKQLGARFATVTNGYTRIAVFQIVHKGVCKICHKQKLARCGIMSKDIARNVGLVTYGNLFLQDRGNDFDIEKLVTDNCYSFDFVGAPIEGIAGSSKVLASNANKWFSFLKDQGAKKLKLFYKKSEQVDLPDHISAAFVGGGSQWVVEVQFDSTSDLYLSGWAPSDNMGIGRGKTHYLRFNCDIPHLDDTSLSVRVAREKLSTVLQDLSEFVGKFEHTKHWMGNFEYALETLNEFEPEVADEFLPAGIYSKEVHQLLQAAFASWVFGGMGSWNDMAFGGADQDQYDSLSEKLYTTLCNSIVSGVNGFT